jgi:hypothetical protein
MTWINISALLEISEYQSFLGKHLLSRKPEASYLVFEDIYQRNPVLCVNQSIVEHTHILMEPQFYDSQWFVAVLR